MSQKHITINQLTNIEANFHLNINARTCAIRMKLGKDKVYTYYKLFKNGMSVEEVYSQYKMNKQRCGRKKIKLSDKKLTLIEDALDEGWSLDAISGRDRLENNPERVSTGTLYARVKEGLISAHKLRRQGKRNPKNHKETRGKINQCKTIHNRNEEYPKSQKGSEFGHFEGDTIIGEKRKSAVITLVEKRSKYIVLLTGSRKSEDVKEAVLKWMFPLKRTAVNTITFDRGKEFSKWREIEKESHMGVGVFFSDPGSPGQRGLNENSNGLVRKELPKSTDLSQYTQHELNEIAKKYNSIPRKSLGYLTAEEVMKKAIGLETLLPMT